MPSTSVSSVYDVDQLAVRVYKKSIFDLLIILSYIPPGSSIDLYKIHVNNCRLLVSQLNSNQHVIILGDFNLCYINWTFDPDEKCFNVNSEIEREVIDSFYEFDVVQINRFVNDFDRILDLIYVDKEISVNICKNIDPISNNSLHHLALSVQISFFGYIKPSNDKSTSYDFAKGNYMAISECMNAIPWYQVLDVDNLSTSYNFFSESFKNAIDRFVPKRANFVKSKPKWFNKRLNNLDNKKKQGIQTISKFQQ